MGLKAATGVAQNQSSLAKRECEMLMNQLLRVSLHTLNDGGGFWPFGGVITAQGDIIRVSAMDEGEVGTAESVVARLEQSFRQAAAAGDIRASAVLVDVMINLPGRGKTDAVQVSLDHEDGHATTIVVPYRVDERCEVLSGEMFATTPETLIFAH